MGVLGEPHPAANNKLPAIVFAIYEQQFAALVPAIAIGAACERGRVLPVIPFTFLWGTVVYNVIAYDVWNRKLPHCPTFGSVLIYFCYACSQWLGVQARST